MRPVALGAALALLLAGCSLVQGPQPDPITLTTDTIAMVGEQAVITNANYVTLCNSKTLPVSQCNAWRKFFEDFRATYPALARTYQTSLQAGKKADAQAAATAIQALSNQLLLYVLIKEKR